MFKRFGKKIWGIEKAFTGKRILRKMYRRCYKKSFENFKKGSLKKLKKGKMKGQYLQ